MYGFSCLGGTTHEGHLDFVSPLITAAQTAALSPGVYYYDLQLTSPAPASVVTTYLAGTVTVEADVTEVSA